MEKHLPVVISVVWGLLFFAGLTGVSQLVRPSKERTKKPETESPWIKTTARYQTILVLAAFFVLGGLLLFPVVSVVKPSLETGERHAVFAVAFIFIVTLGLGLVWALKKGDLRWVRDPEKFLKR